MSTQDPYIGLQILDGQFKIVERIGAGGMGSVYKAEQPDMNRFVAVKLLHRKLTDRKDITARFRREARALSHLTHPNTVRVLLYDELPDGVLCIVMEYLDGKNLHQLVKREGPLPMHRAIPIMVQACGALDEAHKAGIIHRDLKPENIFVTTHGRIKDFAKVLDFGLAKVTAKEMRPGSVALTQEGMIFGTPEFMSPEQAQGKVLTPASDVYSLATILFEALTGKLPFEANTPMEFLKKQVMAAPMLLNEASASKFPKELESILDRALAKAPESRFASAEEFGAAIQAVHLAHKPASVAPPPVSGSMPVPGSMPAANMDSRAPTAMAPRGETPLPPVPKRPINSKVPIAIAFVLGIVAAIVLMKVLGN
jgi:eukaryotic-like serine/threonine-protein kinase